MSRPTRNDWFYKPHRHDEGWDEVRIHQVPRWKESELSGDEWRFSWIAEALRKGEVVKTVEASSLMQALTGIAYEANYSFVPIDETVCMQPTCVMPMTALFRLRKQYDPQGQELVRGVGGDKAVRGFCLDHEHRGDCGMEDSDQNYERVEVDDDD